MLSMFNMYLDTDMLSSGMHRLLKGQGTSDITRAQSRSEGGFLLGSNRGPGAT